ncbi:hypothetical protein [Sphingomonas sp. C3-2]|uniref:hypothetical protein n=1 Tax=Sphingomonas sp. C3-2 TaxID=3062169 RepID=UPI00294AD074|nr:hypothetical protein [Sphingomonas sp. C3-2]WOK37281.1 hypothetical protein QYC26_03580 [Sphingomonas sp. C3-2]
MKGKAVIATGGSDEIGCGIIVKFACEGSNVISASRDVATDELIAARVNEQGFTGAVLPVGINPTDTAAPPPSSAHPVRGDRKRQADPRRNRILCAL